MTRRHGWRSAACLDPATDPDERKRLQAEIDAAAFHAYGLDREETQFVLDDFHRVRDPRMMTEAYTVDCNCLNGCDISVLSEWNRGFCGAIFTYLQPTVYFDLVAEKYDELAEKGPME